MLPFRKAIVHGDVSFQENQKTAQGRTVPFEPFRIAVITSGKIGQLRSFEQVAEIRRNLTLEPMSR